MELFTWKAYGGVLQALKENHYEVATYHNWSKFSRSVILRHDIDLLKALEMAEREKSMGVKSTYFVLLTSDFYNICSAKNRNILARIRSLGHEIGLHFDEMAYPDIAGRDMQAVCEKIMKEVKLLSEIIEQKVACVSMHRPSRQMLEMNLELPGIVNSYSQLFFQKFKYLSDSRRQWREPVMESIKSGMFSRLHILTHAFWYYEQETEIHTCLEKFVNSANRKRYTVLQNNFTDLQKIMPETEVV